MNFTYLYLAIGLYAASFLPVVVAMRTKSKDTKALMFIVDGVLTFAAYTLLYFAIGDFWQYIWWGGGVLLMELTLLNTAYTVLDYDPYGTKAYRKRHKKMSDDYLRGYEDGKGDVR